jgi:hypothetical protein
MYLEYMILYSLYCDMFRHNNAIFREYISRLQTLIINVLKILLLVLISERVNVWLKYVNFVKVSSPTDAQLDSLNNNFKFALKLTLKGSYMFRCEKTPSSRSTLFGPC